MAVTKVGVASMRTQHEPGHKDTPILEVVSGVLAAGTLVITTTTDCEIIKQALSVVLGAKGASAVDCWWAISTTTTPNDTITITGAGTEVLDVWIFGKA